MVPVKLNFDNNNIFLSPASPNQPQPALASPSQPQPAMQRFVLAVVLLVTLAQIGDVLGQHANIIKWDGHLDPPPRPAVFTSWQQYRSYIDALEEYWFMMGRSRSVHSYQKGPGISDSA